MANTKIILHYLTAFITLTLFPMNIHADVVHCQEFDFIMKLHVPHTVDNMQSLGYRKYKNQTFKGTLVIAYDEDGAFDSVWLQDVINKSYKVNKKNVSYESYQDDESSFSPSFLVYIGNNKTQQFKYGSLFFNAALMPDYVKVVTPEVTTDNSFYLQFAGQASTTVDKTALCFRRRLKTIRGNVTGTQGCGCMDYGHISPTRYSSFFFGPNLDYVIDKASAYGIWTAKFRREW